MQKRFVSIWFRYLKTDWAIRRQPALHHVPFVLAIPDHGRLIITAASLLAQSKGINEGMAVADARAIIPSLQVLNDKQEIVIKLLKALAEWCIRYTPVVAIDSPDGLILDATGCAHLWDDEKNYITVIHKRFKEFGYYTRLATANTIGAAWAIARFGKEETVIVKSEQTSSLLTLSPAALRIETVIAEKLARLGLRQISQFINMPRTALRRRFGQQLLQRLDQALGNKEEMLLPVQPINPYEERLACLEPIVTATGIEIALQRLLDTLCQRLHQEEKGLRTVLFKCFRVDGKIQKIEIGTNRPTCNTIHLFKLFQLKIECIEPALGIELFTLEALKVEKRYTAQEKLWENNSGLNNIDLSELLDRIEGKIGPGSIHRYIPDEHYWPARSFKETSSINETSPTTWNAARPRPMQLLTRPEVIEVTAPIPDYPPMLFRYKGKLHKIAKADGPERIEQEWWLQQGRHRDYYSVEDEDGCRYWIFRSGHYDADKIPKWFIHGFFA